MARSKYISSLGRLRPPVRRVLAVDAGSRRLKLLLAQTEFGRLRIVKEELVDLQAEGLVSSEEVQSNLLSNMRQWGRPPVTIVLPQHISISQVVDLPPVPESEQEKLIEDEAVKVSGVSESRMIYDFVRVGAPGHHSHQFWVTMCQEAEIRERLTRLGVEPEDLCDATTTANSLVAAFRAVSPQSHRTILVHMGAQTTVVVILVDGRVTYASNFQMAGDFLTRALARTRNISFEDAELLKRTTDLLSNENSPPEFLAAVEGWTTELKGQLKDWFTRNSAPGAMPNDFQLVASGGGFDQPGFLQHLGKRGIHLQPWPAQGADKLSPSPGFEPAFGAALQALGHTAQAVSLLPSDFRDAWQRRMSRQRLEWASVFLLLITVLFLAWGTWRNLDEIARKEALLAKVRATQELVDGNDELATELVDNYEKVRRVFWAQRNTIDILHALALLQQSRSNQAFWFPLVVDRQSYFTQPPSVNLTNRPTGTNPPPLDISPLMRLPSPPLVAGTNISTGVRPGLIAEVCFPESPENARKTLSELVRTLKQEPIFSKVDLLSEDLRRSLADPKLIIPDKHFALSLEFSETDYLVPTVSRRATNNSPVRVPRKNGRNETGQSAAENFP